MQHFIAEIFSADYSVWKYVAVNLLEPVVDLDTPDIHPAAARLFHGDRFSYCSIKKLTLHDSPIRAKNNIPGVILFTSPPCGRCTRTGKMLWRVVPHDRRLPEFVVPATPKTEFSKHRINSYVLFSVREWSGLHPEGVLQETIGSVDVLDAFYTYCLHAHDLWISLARSASAINRAIANMPQNKNFGGVDRRKYTFVSYDSPGAITFDDAIAVSNIEPHRIRISIAIANVCATIDAVDPELWLSLPPIATSIYMPNAKRPMLPPALGDNLCSLKATTERLAMILDIDFNIVSSEPTIYQLSPQYTFTPVAVVCISRNATFKDRVQDQDQDQNPEFSVLKNIAQNISSKKDVVEDIPGVIRFWMRFANTQFAIMLNKYPAAIFVDETNGGYHTDAGSATYARITSPIRRAADLANQIIIMKEYASYNAKVFAERQIASAHYLANTERSAKKVQSVARMVSICSCQDRNLTSQWGISRPGGIVFFPELNVWFRDPRDCAEQYIGGGAYFSIALFPGAHAPYQKVRIMLTPSTYVES